MDAKIDRVKDPERQIQELKRRWLAHSAPSTMLEQFDELDKGLEGERKRAIQEKSNAKANGPGGLWGMPP